ncbi:hypothetical protein D3C76_1562000 [compost metagenome]
MKSPLYIVGSICGRTIDALSLVAPGYFSAGLPVSGLVAVRGGDESTGAGPWQDPGRSPRARCADLPADYLEHDPPAAFDRLVGLDRGASAAGVVVLCLYSAAHDCLYGVHPRFGLGPVGRRTA